LQLQLHESSMSWNAAALRRRSTPAACSERRGGGTGKWVATV